MANLNVLKWGSTILAFVVSVSKRKNCHIFIELKLLKLIFFNFSFY